ncbi:MAG: hypothetical protein ACREAI_05135 [Nitrososphaera sp.]
MELEDYIRARLDYERNHLDGNPAIKKRAQAWISAIENAPRSADAIQSLMDAKEVAMNKASEVSDLQQLDRELLALEWLKGAVTGIRIPAHPS